jgi:hypothetical protein
MIAALFTPLRRRIQGLIDRCFYRSKYDVRKTLEGFSAQLCNKTDLYALGDDLVRVLRDDATGNAMVWPRRVLVPWAMLRGRPVFVTVFVTNRRRCRCRMK